MKKSLICHSGIGDCVVIVESAINAVMPAKAGIQNVLKILDSPVSSTGQALRRASLEFIRRMLDGMTIMVITTQSRMPESSIITYFLDSGSSPE